MMDKVWIFFACILVAFLARGISGARARDHRHRNYWTKEEYFQHIKDEHPDIWEETMKGGEELDEKK